MDRGDETCTACPAIECATIISPVMHHRLSLAWPAPRSPCVRYAASFNLAHVILHPVGAGVCTTREPHRSVISEGSDALPRLPCASTHRAQCWMFKCFSNYFTLMIQGIHRHGLSSPSDSVRFESLRFHASSCSSWLPLRGRVRMSIQLWMRVRKRYAR